MEVIEAIETQNIIPSSLFGRHHWHLLNRIENWVVMYNEEIQKDRMRSNSTRKPVEQGARQWDKNDSTYLNNGAMIENHDDWDCLKDLEANELVKTYTFKNKSLVKLTEKGFQAFVKLRKFKALGNNTGLFTLEEIKVKEKIKETKEKKIKKVKEIK